MAAPTPPAPPCTLANLESRRFGDTWPIECAGVTLSVDQQVANFNNAAAAAGAAGAAELLLALRSRGRSIVQRRGLV